MEQLRRMSFNENKIFNIAIAVSLLVHFTVLLRLSQHKHQPKINPRKKTEITYQRIKKVDAQKEKEAIKPSKSIQERKLTKTPKALLKDDPTISTPLVKDMAKLDGKFKLDQKHSVKIETKPVQRKISVPELKSEKINNPVYLNYYQVVRSRIKDRAYDNYSKIESGSVYLTFVLFSDGTLKQIKLIEERTTANQYLKDVGLRSIQEASPFPAFPPDLKYPELSFNVVISFEIKDEEN